MEPCLPEKVAGLILTNHHPGFKKGTLLLSHNPTSPGWFSKTSQFPLLKGEPFCTTLKRHNIWIHYSKLVTTNWLNLPPHNLVAEETFFFPSEGSRGPSWALPPAAVSGHSVLCWTCTSASSPMHGVNSTLGILWPRLWSNSHPLCSCSFIQNYSHSFT